MGPPGVQLGPPREVTFKPFWVAKRWVTVGEFQQCVDAGACDHPDDPKYAEERELQVPLPICGREFGAPWSNLHGI